MHIHEVFCSDGMSMRKHRFISLSHLQSLQCRV
ncbi:hypothetical protein HID58_016550 [Brassica napus]|uniref:Uncharacterized protein n=1 Tax=Brassica napus TaxID=3708 RepID=A0ABQ8DND3_BRANA|nr:hypothetical protein HID58_016550 [Brassica napus]